MKKLKYLIILFHIIPVIMAFIYVYLFGVNVPFWDDWELVPYFDKFYSGTLTCSDLFAQHSDHVMFFSRIFMLITGILSKFNLITEMYCTLCLFLAGLIIIFIHIKTQYNVSLTSFWLIPLSYLVFSWRQSELFLMGFNILFLLVYVFTITGFYSIYRLSALNRQGIIYFISAMISGTIASFSGTMGLFIWPAGLIQIILLPVKKTTTIFYGALWSAAGILEWILFFSKYHRPDTSPDIFYSFLRPLDVLHYFLICLGTSLFWDESTAIIWSVLVIILFALCIFLLYKYKRLKENSFWLAISIFSLLTILCISAGRATLGMAQAFTSRYTIFSILTVIALYCMFLDLLFYEKKRFIKILAAFLFFIIFISMPYSCSFGFRLGEFTRKERTHMADILLTYEAHSDNDLKILYDPDGVVRQRAHMLKKWGWNVFSR